MIIYSKLCWLATKGLVNPPSSLGIVTRTSPITIYPQLELISVSKNKNFRGLSANCRSGILLDKNASEPSRVPTIEVNESFIAGAQAVLIIFDLNDPQSFEEIEDYWLTEAKNNISDETIIFIIGNKCDMEHTVLDGRIEQFSREAGVKNYNVSAKTG